MSYKTIYKREYRFLACPWSFGDGELFDEMTFFVVGVVVCCRRRLLVVRSFVRSFVCCVVCCSCVRLFVGVFVWCSFVRVPSSVHRGHPTANTATEEPLTFVRQLMRSWTDENSQRLERTEMNIKL